MRIPADYTPPEAINLLGLRTAHPPSIESTYAGYTRTQFDRHKGISVLIPSHNEQTDLPSTLLALARSTLPVRPIVIDNASSDRTAEIADTMGAEVISEPVPGKMQAVRTGLRMIETEGLPGSLMIDADTLVMRHWAKRMTLKTTQLCSDEKPAMILGLGIYDHNPRLHVDILRNIRLAKSETKRLFKNSVLGKEATPSVHGFNTYVKLDSRAEFLEALDEFPPNLMPGQDEAMRDSIKRTGGKLIRVLDPSTWVYTRNDRPLSAKDVFVKGGDNHTRHQMYKTQYPCVPYLPVIPAQQAE